MRKRIKGRKFHRKTGPRKALLKTLASSLILKEKIETTEAKAKELSSFIEREITKAKKGDLPARRGMAKLFAPKVVKKLMDKIEFVIHCWPREMRSEKLETNAQKKGKATTALPFDIKN